MDWEQIDKQMAKETAKKGLMAKVLALPMTVRVIAAVVCLGILAGAYVLIAKSLDKDENSGVNVVELSDAKVNEMEQMDVLPLLDLSESEIVAMFGESKMEEYDSYLHYSYNFASEDGKQNQFISITFNKDIFGSECPVSVAFSGNIISIYDINTDTDPETVRGILESKGLVYDRTDKHSYDGVEYVSEYYYTRDRADVKICVTYSEGGINSVDIYRMWDYGPNGEILPATGYFGEEDIVIDEPVIDEEPIIDEDSIIDEESVTDESEIEEEPVVEEEPEVPAMTNDEAHRILEDYWGKHCAAGGAWYYFVDLSGDGIDEMLNIVFDYEWGDGMTQIYMVQGNNVVKVSEKYSGTTNGNMIEYYLYTENGRNYILEYNSFMREGYGEIYYKVYSFNATGNEIELRGNSYSGDMLSTEGENASVAIYKEFTSYKANCPGIMYQTLDGGTSDLW